MLTKKTTKKRKVLSNKAKTPGCFVAHVMADDKRNWTNNNKAARQHAKK